MEDKYSQLQQDIQSFVNQQADPATREQLQKAAATDPTVSDELAFSQSLSTLLRHQEMAAVAATIKQVVATEGFPPPETNTPTSSMGKWALWGGAAIVGLLLLAGVYGSLYGGWWPSKAQVAARNHWTPLDNVLFLPPDGPGLAQLQAGMKAYDAGQYRAAATQLRAYLNQQPDHAARLYLGVALLLDQQASQAVEPLQMAARSDEPPIREAALWYLSLAWIETGDSDSAKATLRQIPPDSPYAKPGAEILSQLP